MKPIELEIFFYEKEQMSLVELGLGDDVPIKDCSKRNMLFLNIAAIAPYKEEGKEYTAIHCNGTDFISPVKYEELKEKLTSSGLYRETLPPK